MNTAFKKLLFALLLLVNIRLSAQYLGGSGRGETRDIAMTELLDGITATATELIFTVSPANSNAFSTFSATVQAVGPNNLRFNLSAPVSMSIDNNPGSGTLLGNTTIFPLSGFIEFTILSINNVGNGYTLRASSPGLSAATSNAFDIAFNQYAGGSGDGHTNNSYLNALTGGQKLWRGGTSTDWAAASNWYPSGVPASTDAISIENNGFTNNPILDANRTVTSIDFGGATKKIEVGTYVLTVSEAIFNSDANNYVKTASTGTLKRNISNAAAFTFPVGNSAYNPVSITNNTGASDAFTVRILDEVYSQGFTGSVATQPRIKRTWDISKTNPNAGSGVNVVFNWNTGEATNNITAHKLYHYNGTAWDKQTGTTSVSGNSLTYTGYTGNFSPFAISDDIIMLPVTWLNFRCEATAEGPTQLQWRTAMEQNTRTFLVERSAEGQTYQSIGEVTAAGYSQTLQNYTFTDKQPLPSGGYYRIRMDDMQGNSSYSDVCNSKGRSVINKALLKVFPNPTDGGLYMIALEPERNFVWEVVSATGQRVATGNSKEGQAKARLHHLSEGLYQLRIIGSGLSENHRILIHR